MTTCKMNIVNRSGSYSPECTNCNHRFETNYAENPYREMCSIAKGKYAFCPVCGAKYIDCQIDGVDFDKCASHKRDWINRGIR